LGVVLVVGRAGASILASGVSREPLAGPSGVSREQSNHIHLLGDNRCTHRLQENLPGTLLVVKGASMLCRGSMRRTECLLAPTRKGGNLQADSASLMCTD
jgi:hypothetical protein